MADSARDDGEMSGKKAATVVIESSELDRASTSGCYGFAGGLGFGACEFNFAARIGR
jgi:hypothetical protein